MTETETRKLLEAYCEELDRERAAGSRLRRFLLPAALGLAISGCGDETPIALPYLGPMPDGRPDVRRPDSRGPDAAPRDGTAEPRPPDAGAKDRTGEK